jgi:hypothetical protein
MEKHWLDELDRSEVTIGRRTGHCVDMRKWALKEFKDKVVDMTDEEIFSLILDSGYVPIRVNGDCNLEDDGVFLIKRDELKNLPCFSR